MKKILFTGGGGAAAESLWRSLSEKYYVYFADACVESIADSIPDKQKLEIPFASSSNFITAVREVCQKNGIDLIVPSVDEELLPLCEGRHDDMPEILAPSADFVKLMLDKLECAKALKKEGLAVPKTLPVIGASEIGFPLIVKPRSGRGSRGVCVLESQAEIEAYQVLYKVFPDSLLAQQLVEGVEYTVLVAGDSRGRLKAIIPVNVGQKNGITIRAKTELNSDVIEYSKKFHKIFKPHGIYNIQCILTTDGEVLPFEVNPRVSTTFCLGIASGFDPFDKDFEADNQPVFLPRQGFSLKRNWFNSIRKM